MQHSLGTSLAHYQILELIGRGGMGEVYRARDTKLDRDVAIKVLPDELAGNADRVARFEREAKLLAALNHPHIAAIYGVETTGAAKFLVLELVPGETLAERIDRGPLALDEIRDVAKQIVSALESAHERGIVHRDLKPANVKITPDGDVKVLDFGLAKAAGGDSDGATDASDSPTLTKGTALGVIMGTAAYMSPEQARGRAVDKRTDIWAFGVILFEMLTGKRLFRRDTVTDTLAAVVNTEPDFGALPASTTPAVRRLLRRCLIKDKKARLPDVGVARLELDDDGTESTVTTSTRTRPPHEGLFMGLIAVALVLLGALVSTWLTSTDESTHAPVMRLSLSLPEQNALLNLDGSRQIAISPDGSTLAYSAGGQLHVRRLDEDMSTPLAGTIAAGSPSFSPDGEWIAFAQGDELKKIPVNGGTIVSLAAKGQFFVGLNWGADDTIVYSVDGDVHRVPASGGPSKLVAESLEGQIALHPFILPDGSAVLHTESSVGGFSIVAQSLSDGTRRTVLQGAGRPRYLPTGHLLYVPQDAIGELRAVSFDTERLVVTGNSVTVLSNVLSDVGRGDSQFDVSQSGTAIYVATAGKILRSIVRVDRRGLPTALPLEPAEYLFPALAPDGTRLATSVARASGGSDIWIYELESATKNRLTFEGEGFNQPPVWSPDGSSLVFASGEQTLGHLVRKVADGTGPKLPLTSSGVGQFPHAWSRNGHIVFAELVPGSGLDLRMLDVASGSEPVTLLASEHSETRASLSRDGNWLAYTSDESGRNEIYIRPFPNVDNGKWQLSTDGGHSPIWLGQGGEIVYRGVGSMMSARVSTASGSPIVVEAPKPLFDDLYVNDQGGRSYDVSADGESFYMIRETGIAMTNATIRVIVNWFQELERLAPHDEAQ